MTHRQNRDPAAARFAIINIVRLASACVTLLGMAIAAGKIGDTPALGIVLIVLGMFGFFFAPKLLARRWRSPPE